MICGLLPDSYANRVYRALNQLERMQRLRQGEKWTFKAPLGYINGDGRNGNPSLVHDPKRGPLVKQAFDLCATGLYTTQKVLEMITAVGLRTARGKPVTKQTFSQLLRKPVYTGRIQVGGWGDS